jgi:dTDP-4-dehydrorhamnose reductase
MTKAKNIIVTGVSGQVGQALGSRLGHRAHVLSRQQLDLSQPKNIPAILAEYRPDIIINAAAYTAVDQAESEEALATTINGDAVGVLAEYCFSHHIPLVHFSTDYVFNGDGNTAWKEDTNTQPLNAYGRSKLAGEQAIVSAANNFERALPKWLIFRTSWVYSQGQKNFLDTMLRLGKERDTLSVVADQIGAPTYAADIASYAILALDVALKAPHFPSGIYHLCNQGETSWHGFAKEIFTQAESLGIPLAIKEVSPITSADYPTPAARPKNSRLDTHKFQDVFSLTLPEWQEALSRCLNAKKGL